MEYTEKQLTEKLNISQPALFKALKETPYKLKEIEQSSKELNITNMKIFPKDIKIN